MEAAIFNIVRQSQVSVEGIRGLVRVAITEGLGTYWGFAEASGIPKGQPLSHD
jgi:hypothetical protein